MKYQYKVQVTYKNSNGIEKQKELMACSTISPSDMNKQDDSPYSSFVHFRSMILDTHFEKEREHIISFDATLIN